MKTLQRFAAVTTGLLIAIPLVFNLPAVAAPKPKIVKAKLVDRNGNGLADRVVLTYSKKIKHRADVDGSYPFRIQGYGIKKVLRAKGTRKLKINLLESAEAPAKPAIRYRPTKRQPVTDMRNRQARKQRFLGVIELPSVSNGLTVTVEGPGSVTSVPAGIDCGTTCQATFDDGATVALTAVPDAAAGAVFTGWGGDCASFSEASICILTIDGSKTVSATFQEAASTALLTVTKLGEGTVVSTPPGVDCGAACAAEFAAGTAVSLTALPAPGSVFSGWGGDCASFGTAPDCLLTLDADKTVSATFESAGVPLDLSVLGTGAGEVTSDPAGLLCTTTGGVCATVFPEGTTVTLTAVPDLLSTFGGWGGDCASFGVTPVCVLTMDAAKTVTATFDPLI